MPEGARLGAAFVPSEFALADAHAQTVTNHLIPEVPLPLARRNRMAVIIATPQDSVGESDPRRRVKSEFIANDLGERLNAALRAFARVVADPIRRVSHHRIHARQPRQQLQTIPMMQRELGHQLRLFLMCAS
jgi:hypothetical protein